MDWLKARLDYTNDIHKQMLTLATGVLALTATFFSNHQITGLIYASWGFLILSILAGITGMGGLIERAKTQTDPGRAYMMVQSWSFLTGLLLFIASILART